ncbi:hypothetical protein ACJW30_01G312100 [Castanea mollissima]
MDDWEAKKAMLVNRGRVLNADDEIRNLVPKHHKRTSQKGYTPKARRGQLLNAWKSTLTYQRLPQEPLNLSILKLDGSCFGVQVGRKATIAELKEAVEEVFSGQFTADGEISWSHVWGHFCLSYQGQKLVDDKAYIRLFGIKDGVQLCFCPVSFN